MPKSKSIKQMDRLVDAKKLAQKNANKLGVEIVVIDDPTNSKLFTITTFNKAEAEGTYFYYKASPK